MEKLDEIVKILKEADESYNPRLVNFYNMTIDWKTIVSITLATAEKLNSDGK